MLRFLFRSPALVAPLALAALSVSAAAQERGEEVLGAIVRANGRSFVLKHEDGREIPFRVTPSTTVYFQDSGDRKLFPNPTIDDLRTGMEVRFVYGTGTPDRVVVFYVPAGFVRPSPSPEARREEVRGRIQSIDRSGRALTALVDGRARTFTLENRNEAAGFRSGDLVVLTVEDRGQGPLVTKIEPGGLVGTVRQMDLRGGTVVIEVDGRDETYYVNDRGLLETIRTGDRVRFEVEQRGSRRLIVAIRRHVPGRY